VRARSRIGLRGITVRSRLIEALKLALVGPVAGHALGEERPPD